MTAAVANGYRLSNELRTACRDGGDMSTVSTLYVKSAQADTANKRNILHSMAMIAIRTGNPSLLQFCFQHGLVKKGDAIDPEILQGVLDSATQSHETGRSRSSSAASSSSSSSEKEPKDIGLRLIKVLVNHGWDVNQALESGGDAMAIACARGSTPVVEYLLSHGAAPNSGAVCGSWIGPIHAVASENRSQAVLEELLGHGLKVQGNGVMVAAAEHGNVEAVRRLLQCSEIDIEEVVEYGPYDARIANERGTALYKAAKEGHADVCRLLIARGASVEYEDPKGRSVRDVAERKRLDLDELSQEPEPAPAPAPTPSQAPSETPSSTAVPARGDSHKEKKHAEKEEKGEKVKEKVDEKEKEKEKVNEKEKEKE